MTSRRTWACALALGSLASLTLAPAAGSHGGGGVAHRTEHLKLDPGEVAALGKKHATEHAELAVLKRQTRKRWQRMTPAQRRARIRSTERANQRLESKLATQTRDDIGVWSGNAQGKPFPLPDYAIHVSMMPTGELLYFGRPPLDPDGIRPNFGAAWIFDPSTGNSRRVDPPPIPENEFFPAPLFCAGQALLSDGRVLVVGGNLTAGDEGTEAAGLKKTFLFDPWTETWEIGPDMSGGRWYPSVVKLTSGDFLIMSGLNEHGTSVTNPEMDLFRPGIDDVDNDGNPGTPLAPLVPFPGGYRGPDAVAPSGQYYQSLYPRMFTLPDRDVVLAGPKYDESAILDTADLDDRNAVQGSAWTQIPRGNFPTNHYYGASVLEPQMNNFTGTWRVLTMGGYGGEADPASRASKDVVERLDANPARPGGPGWQPPDPAEKLKKARSQLNTVLLPDGGMVAVGGSSGIGQGALSGYYIAPGDSTKAALRQVELRRPGEKTWRLGAAQQEWRTYHSTASLLPDGRIFSAGDDYHEGPDPFGPVPDATRRDSAEIYWPPYLFNGNACAPRPVIRSVASPAPPAGAHDPWATLTYGDTFGIFTEHATAGMQAVLVAPSQVTHSFDMNQRVVPLQITGTVPGGGLNAKVPPSAGVAPPGWYMLFVVHADGTPSISRWVKVSAADGGVPALVAGVSPNPQPRTCVEPPIPVSPPAPPPPAPPSPPPPAATKLPAKLSVDRATIRRSSGKLDLTARITGLASGTVKVEFRAGGRRTRFTTRIDSAKRRIVALRKLPRSQAKLGTGIVTIDYDGDVDTFAQSVRLRAAPHAAKLRMKPPTLTAAGRVRANGTISKRARGVVQLQLQFGHGANTRTVRLRATISRGAWKLDERLAASVRQEIAERSGPVQSYALFTGYKRAGIRGEMRSFEVLGTP